MIILDTNVLSEALRPSPDRQVMDWLASQSATALFTTTITQGELLYGVFLLPEGQRKAELLAAIRDIFEQDLHGRVLGFDAAAAEAYARRAVERRLAGQPISQFDAMIAAIAATRGAALATRNGRDFAGCGIRLIDPWRTAVP